MRSKCAWNSQDRAMDLKGKTSNGFCVFAVRDFLVHVDEFEIFSCFVWVSGMLNCNVFVMENKVMKLSFNDQFSSETIMFLNSYMSTYNVNNMKMYVIYLLILLEAKSEGQLQFIKHYMQQRKCTNMKCKCEEQSLAVFKYHLGISFPAFINKIY